MSRRNSGVVYLLAILGAFVLIGTVAVSAMNRALAPASTIASAVPSLGVLAVGLAAVVGLVAVVGGGAMYGRRGRYEVGARGHR